MLAQLNRQSDTAVGLDIGKDSIKLVQLKREDEEVLLDKIDLARVAPAQEQNPEDGRAIKNLIAELISRNQIESKNIILGINGQSAFIKFSEVLPVSADKLEQTLKYEAQQQIPFSLDEVEWDSHLFGSLQQGQAAPHRVLLVAVKKERLAAKEGLLAGTNLHPAVLDLSNLSIYNCIRFNRDCDPKKLNAVLHIGAQSTDLLIVKGDNLWMRSIAIGGDNITSALAKKSNISFAEAEELKRKMTTDSPDFKATVAPVLEDLQGEIERSIEFYYFQEKPLQPQQAQAAENTPASTAVKVEEILLSGGTALLPGLEQFLAEKFSCRLRAVEPFKMLKVNEEVKAKLGSGQKTIFTQAVGLALRGLSQSCVKINLFKGQIQARKLQQQKLLYGVGSLALSLLILFGASSFMRRDYRAKSLRRQSLKARLSAFAAYQPQMAALKNTQALLSTQVNILQNMAMNRSLWLEVLAQLSKMLPGDLWITELSGTIPFDVSADEYLQSKIDLKGRAVSYEEVNSFVAKLKSSPLFTEVKPLSSAYIEEQAKDSKKVELVKFSISMKVAPIQEQGER